MPFPQKKLNTDYWGMATESCPVRSTLSKAVSAAITESFRANGEYDTAKRKRADNADTLAGVFRNARAAERAAIRALRKHIDQHGCKI